jgi:hypothetical protein
MNRKEDFQRADLAERMTRGTGMRRIAVLASNALLRVTLSHS